jgi:hypothetical protein
MMRSVLAIGAMVLTMVWPVVTSHAADPEPELFALAFRGQTFPFRDVSTFVLPDATVIFEAVGGPPGTYTFTAHDGVLVPMTTRKWRWTAPSTPGLYTLKIDDPRKKDTITLRAFVLVPATLARGGYLEGYQIGEYPPRPAGGSSIYAPPPGFIEVTKHNADTKVSPHFRLRQFICKQEPIDRFPKYVVLQERLLVKLEAILAGVKALGVDADTLHVMSAYRTPFYNHEIGDVRYSMHQWGSAADIYVDTRRKDRMDDLNRDGQIDTGDSRFLYDLIEGMLAARVNRNLEGGMGWYPATAAHPPFVHVDVRGTRARWQG